MRGVEYVAFRVEEMRRTDFRVREGYVGHRRKKNEPSRRRQMGKTALDDVTGQCQGKVAASGVTPYDDVLRLESDLADKVLVRRDCVDDCS